MTGNVDSGEDSALSPDELGEVGRKRRRESLRGYLITVVGSSLGAGGGGSLGGYAGAVYSGDDSGWIPGEAIVGLVIGGAIGVGFGAWAALRLFRRTSPVASAVAAAILSPLALIAGFQAASAVGDLEFLIMGIFVIGSLVIARWMTTRLQSDWP